MIWEPTICPCYLFVCEATIKVNFFRIHLILMHFYLYIHVWLWKRCAGFATALRNFNTIKIITEVSNGILAHIYLKWVITEKMCVRTSLIISSTHTHIKDSVRYVLITGLMCVAGSR